MKAGKPKPVDPAIELVKVDEAERALVSILLNYPEQAMLAVADENFLTSDIFNPRLRRIADIVLGQIGRNKSTDVRVVYELIRQHEPMEFADLTDLYMVSPVLTPLREFISIVRTASKRRALQIVLHEAQSTVKQGELPEFISGLVAAAEGIGDQISPPKTADTKAQYLEALTRYESGDDQSHRIRTGFTALDNITPIKKSDFIVVGGETKSGKTTFVLNVIAHILYENQKNQAR
jgi:replicative DNA helicase